MFKPRICRGIDDLNRKGSCCMQKHIEDLKKIGFEVFKVHNKFIIRNSTLTIMGTAENTIFTAHGVLCEECYGFSCTEDHIVFDIGLNIGISALYFAKNPRIKHIYGFEPFGRTFRQALLNLENNKELSTKITACNFGVGGVPREITMAYNPALPGSMSTIVDRFAGKGPLEKATIKNVADVFKPIMAKHKEKILLKMDCEGGEYEIIPELETHGLLSSINIIQMEWHFAFPQQIIDVLKRNGFISFYSQSIVGVRGYIYGVRIK